MARRELKVMNGNLHQRVFRDWLQRGNPWTPPPSKYIWMARGMVLGIVLTFIAWYVMVGVVVKGN